jgi:hypothetical protein
MSSDDILTVCLTVFGCIAAPCFTLFACVLHLGRWPWESQSQEEDQR